MIDGASELRLAGAGGLSFTAWSLGQGPLVLLLHGFPDTPGTFRHQLPALAAAGFRAVAVTTRGYEPSSQPDNGNYRLDALAGDVVDWVEALGESQAHLVGHDWGATIAYGAVARSPRHFRSLTTLTVPYPRRFGEVVMTDAAQLQRSDYILFFQQIGVAEQQVAARDGAYLEELWRKWSPGWEPDAAALASMKRQFGKPGVVQSALAYYRQALDAASPLAVATQQLLAQPVQVPTLGVYGARDECIGADVFERSMQPGDFPAGLRIERIESAGHFPHLEAPASVNAALLGFIGRLAALG